MKQHIDLSQLNELSEKGKERLRDWWKPQEGDWVNHNSHEDCLYPEMLFSIEPYPYSDEHLVQFNKKEDKNGYLPLLSIGQLIEFLDEQKWQGCLVLGHYVGGWVVGDDDHYLVKSWKKEELCDALWEAVKEVLEKEEV